MQSRSSVSPDYMSQQFDINDRMRGILIDWLIEVNEVLQERLFFFSFYFRVLCYGFSNQVKRIQVHYKFELMEETLYLTVNLIDRFLALQPVVRKKLQLVGVTAMLLACKYEEVTVPVVEDLILISDKAYTRNEVLEMVGALITC